MTHNTSLASEGISFTQFNSNNPLNKLFDKDGKKISRANMYDGTYQTKSANSVTELFEIFDTLLPNQAIGLGISNGIAGMITTNAKVTDTSIARTKEYFNFAGKAYLLIDYDPSKYGIDVKSPKDLVQLLRETDPLLEDVEIGVRYGSSYGIYKDGVLISSKKSMHAYFVIENASNEKVKQYKDYLISSAWAKGLGHIELSKIGSIMKRQFFDAAVFSPERLIFESEPTLAEGITRVVPEVYIEEGTIYRDLENIDAPPIEAVQMMLEAKAKVTDKSLELNSNYIKKEVDKCILQGLKNNDARRIVNSRVNDKILLPDDILLTNDNIQIKVAEILKNPTKFDDLYLHDPLEYEKGASKARINAKNPDAVFIHSFLHGGLKFTIRPDFNYIVNIVENSYDTGPKSNRVLIEDVKVLCEKADLTSNDRKQLATILKQKKIASSISVLEPEKQKVELAVPYPDMKKDQPLMTMTNLMALAKHYNINMKYDVILKIAHMTFDTPMPITDDMANTQIALITDLCVKNNLPIGVVDKYLGAIIDLNSFNPLSNMIKTPWDGIDRISQVIDTITTNDDPFYKEQIITKWLIQCTAAWEEAENTPLEDAKPRYENVLVLVGKQGISKTKFFENLMPKKFRQYVVTGIHLDPSDKDSIMLAVKAGITELGELDSTFKKDMGRLKGFLSKDVDILRRPYDRRETTFKRRTSFGASVNDDEFLVDDTGSRRFYPLKIEAIDFKTYVLIDKVQLWAQVYQQLYLEGHHWWIDAKKDVELNTMLTKKHIEHFVMSSADEIAALVIETTKEAKESEKFLKTATEIAIAFKLPASGRKNLTIIKKALTHAGIPFNSKTKQFLVKFHS